MDNKQLFERLRQVVINYDEVEAEKVAHEILELEIEPYRAILEGLAPAIREMGERFERKEIYLPELIMAADAMSAAVTVLERDISREQRSAMEKGKIVIGTVKGDIHNIGKNIVALMLQVDGFEVIDLGVDVAPGKFIEAAEEHNADIIGVSALMTFTIGNMKTLTEYLETEGLRDKYKLIYGGGPLSESWAKELGADAYAQDALKAVKVVNKLMDR